MDPRENPFAPGAGSQPPELPGRDEPLEAANVALARVSRRSPTKSLILVGLRGVGKTVLLNRVSERASADSFHTVLVEAHEEKPLPHLLLPPLRQILYSLDLGESTSEKVKRGFRVL